MYTLVQLVNKVLLRLREDPVANCNDTTYSQLICEYVNQAKEELENMWDWSALRSNISIVLGTDGTTTDVALTGTNQRTKIKAVYNNTQDYQLQKVSREYMNRLILTNDDIAGEPKYYTTAGIDSSGQIKLKLYPASETADTLTVSVIKPEAELVNDTDTTVLPHLPLVLKAYTLAVSERGEDGGAGWEETAQATSVAIGDAILQDQQWFADELTWYPN